MPSDDSRAAVLRAAVEKMPDGPSRDRFAALLAQVEGAPPAAEPGGAAEADGPGSPAVLGSSSTAGPDAPPASDDSTADEPAPEHRRGWRRKNRSS